MGSTSGIVIKRPSGIIAGLTAAWAIFGLFLALDQEMGLEPGALFRMVGIAFGVDPPNAICWLSPVYDNCRYYRDDLQRYM